MDVGRQDGNVVTFGRLYLNTLSATEEALHAACIEGDVDVSACAGSFD